ncbi:aquaporin-like protein [Hymenopellis radicata]|nr:aquaporin-like protein [Hymenopellis radicata]
MIHAVGSSDPSVVHLADVAPRARIFTRFERMRHAKAHWFSECFAEFMGVFFYCYAGVGSTVPWVVGNALGQVGLSSIFQIGIAYATGIIFALGVCSATSGGHFNPGITIALTIFKGFPKVKAVRYIIAQILGGYVACLLVYCQYRNWLDEADAAMAAAGTLEALKFTPSGTAGIFGLYVMPGSKLGQVFLNEFVSTALQDVVLAMIIWGSVDPTNILIPPAMAPVVIALGYAAMVWGFALDGLATNAARDLGGRFAALTIYGGQASGGAYAAIAALTNIPATLFGACLYELCLADSMRVVPSASLEFMNAHRHHGCLHNHDNSLPSPYARSSTSDDKPEITTFEHV